MPQPMPVDGTPASRGIPAGLNELRRCVEHIRANDKAGVCYSHAQLVVLEAAERLLAGRLQPEELQNVCHNLSLNDRCAFVRGCLALWHSLGVPVSYSTRPDGSRRISVQIEPPGTCQPFVSAPTPPPVQAPRPTAPVPPPLDPPVSPYAVIRTLRTTLDAISTTQPRHDQHGRGETYQDALALVQKWARSCLAMTAGWDREPATQSPQLVDPAVPTPATLSPARPPLHAPPQPAPYSVWRHRDGGLYVVEGVSRCSTNGEEGGLVVVYRDVKVHRHYSRVIHEMHHRALHEFMDGRFTEVTE